MEYPPFVLNGLLNNGQHAVSVGYLQQQADELRAIGLGVLEAPNDAAEYTARTQENIDRQIALSRASTGGVSL